MRGKNQNRQHEDVDFFNNHFEVFSKQQRGEEAISQ